MYDLPSNPKNLRVIKTACSKETINDAARSGFWPLLKEVERADHIRRVVNVYQHEETGEVVTHGDRRWRPKVGFKRVLPTLLDINPRFPEPYAAYLIPKDIVKGEHVWLERVIEPLVAVWGGQGTNNPLRECEAIWDGENFAIQYDEEKEAIRLIG